MSTNLSLINSSLNWEDASFVLNNDLSFFISFLQAYEPAQTWSTGTITFFSPLFTIFSITLGNNNLLHYFYTDLWLLLYSLYFQELFSLGTELVLYHTLQPEYLTALTSYILHLSELTFESPAVLYDLFTNNFNSWTLVDLLLFHVWTPLLLMFTLLLLHQFSDTTIVSGFAAGSLIKKFFIFFNTFSAENRLQLDWTLLFVLFTLLIFIPLLMTFDDTNAEIVELTHFTICGVFILSICLLLIKYSTHYFSFLEGTVSEGFSVSYIAKQFVRDVSNTFALFLRFFLLLFRLNIYDGLDDFLDSYYIFFIDFDEDAYLDEIFFPLDFNSFWLDNREDIALSNVTEYDGYFDLYSKFFILFGKFFFFFALILEEAFRVSLALYISYLIIFEVHAVNLSYGEESLTAVATNRL